MKKIMTFLVCLCMFFVVNVNAEELHLKLVSESDKTLSLDVVVTNVTGANNVFEGELKYDKANVTSLKVVPVDGWEIHTRDSDGKIKFFVFSMDKVAEENTSIFKVDTKVKDDAKITLGNVATASGNVGISLNEVIYSYKETVVELPKVEHEDTPKVEETEKEEISIPNDDLINNIEGSEDEEVIENIDEEEIDDLMNDEKKEDNEISKTVVSILVAVAIVALAFVFLFRKRKGGVR